MLDTGHWIILSYLTILEIAHFAHAGLPCICIDSCTDYSWFNCGTYWIMQPPSRLFKSLLVQRLINCFPQNSFCYTNRSRDAQERCFQYGAPKSQLLILTCPTSIKLRQLSNIYRHWLGSQKVGLSWEGNLVSHWSLISICQFMPCLIANWKTLNSPFMISTWLMSGGRFIPWYRTTLPSTQSTKHIAALTNSS